MDGFLVVDPVANHLYGYFLFRYYFRLVDLTSLKLIKELRDGVCFELGAALEVWLAELLEVGALVAALQILVH